MAKKPGLQDAYTLGGVEDVKALYADWAGSYDSDFAAEKGYLLHRHVAQEYASSGGSGPVLDVGAGTGLVGQALAAAGIEPIHGTDISAEMLELAQAKGCYESTFVADITQEMDIANETYDGIVSAGTFTLGHLGPEPLPELIRLLMPGGIMVIAVNGKHWVEAGFDQALGALGSILEDIARRSVPIYAQSANHDHASDHAFLVKLKKA